MASVIGSYYVLKFIWVVLCVSLFFFFFLIHCPVILQGDTACPVFSLFSGEILELFSSFPVMSNGTVVVFFFSSLEGMLSHVIPLFNSWRFGSLTYR